MLATGADAGLAAEFSAERSRSTLRPTNSFDPLTDTREAKEALLHDFRESAESFYVDRAICRAVRLAIRDVDEVIFWIAEDLDGRQLAYFDYRKLYRDGDAFVLPVTGSAASDGVLIRYFPLSGPVSGGAVTVLRFADGRDVGKETVRIGPAKDNEARDTEPAGTSFGAADAVRLTVERDIDASAAADRIAVWDEKGSIYEKRLRGLIFMARHILDDAGGMEDAAQAIRATPGHDGRTLFDRADEVKRLLAALETTPVILLDAKHWLSGMALPGVAIIGDDPLPYHARSSPPAIFLSHEIFSKLCAQAEDEMARRGSRGDLCLRTAIAYILAAAASYAALRGEAVAPPGEIARLVCGDAVPGTSRLDDVIGRLYRSSQSIARTRVAKSVVEIFGNDDPAAVDPARLASVCRHVIVDQSFAPVPARIMAERRYGSQLVKVLAAARSGVFGDTEPELSRLAEAVHARYEGVAVDSLQKARNGPAELAAIFAGYPSKAVFDEVVFRLAEHDAIYIVRFAGLLMADDPRSCRVFHEFLARMPEAVAGPCREVRGLLVSVTRDVLAQALTLGREESIFRAYALLPDRTALRSIVDATGDDERFLHNASLAALREIGEWEGAARLLEDLAALCVDPADRQLGRKGWWVAHMIVPDLLGDLLLDLYRRPSDPAREATVVKAVRLYLDSCVELHEPLAGLTRLSECNSAVLGICGVARGRELMARDVSADLYRAIFYLAQGEEGGSIDLVRKASESLRAYVIAHPDEEGTIGVMRARIDDLLSWFTTVGDLAGRQRLSRSQKRELASAYVLLAEHYLYHTPFVSKAALYLQRAKLFGATDPITGRIDQAVRWRMEQEQDRRAQVRKPLGNDGMALVESIVGVSLCLAALVVAAECWYYWPAVWQVLHEWISSVQAGDVWTGPVFPGVGQRVGEIGWAAFVLAAGSLVPLGPRSGVKGLLEPLSGIELRLLEESIERRTIGITPVSEQLSAGLRSNGRPVDLAVINLDGARALGGMRTAVIETPGAVRVILSIMAWRSLREMAPEARAACLASLVPLDGFTAPGAGPDIALDALLRDLLHHPSRRSSTLSALSGVIRDSEGRLEDRRRAFRAMAAEAGEPLATRELMGLVPYLRDHAYELGVELVGPVIERLTGEKTGIDHDAELDRLFDDPALSAADRLEALARVTARASADREARKALLAHSSDIIDIMPLYEKEYVRYWAIVEILARIGITSAEDAIKRLAGTTGQAHPKTVGGILGRLIRGSAPQPAEEKPPSGEQELARQSLGNLQHERTLKRRDMPGKADVTSETIGYLFACCAYGMKLVGSIGVVAFAAGLSRVADDATVGSSRYGADGARHVLTETGSRILRGCVTILGAGAIFLLSQAAACGEGLYRDGARQVAVHDLMNGLDRTSLMAFGLGMRRRKGTEQHNYEETRSRYLVQEANAQGLSLESRMAKFREAYRLDKNNPECLYGIGRILMLRNEFEDAETWFRRALRVTEKMSRTGEHDGYVGWVRHIVNDSLANLYRSQGRLEDALVCAEDSLKAMSGRIIGYEVKAKVLHAMVSRILILEGRAEARRFCRQLLERLRPDIAQYPGSFIKRLKVLTYEKEPVAVPRPFLTDEARRHIVAEHRFVERVVSEAEGIKTCFPPAADADGILRLVDAAMPTAVSLRYTPDGAEQEWWPEECFVSYAEDRDGALPLRLNIIARPSGEVLTAHPVFGPDVTSWMNGTAVPIGNLFLVPELHLAWNRATRLPIAMRVGDGSHGFIAMLNSPALKGLRPAEREQLIWLAAIEGRPDREDTASRYFRYDIPFEVWSGRIGVSAVILRVDKKTLAAEAITLPGSPDAEAAEAWEGRPPAEGSPATMYAFLRDRYPNEYATAEAITRLNHLSLEYTNRRDLNVLVFLGLVERRVVRREGAETTEYRARGLDPAAWAKARPVLASLGARATAAGKQEARAALEAAGIIRSSGNDPDAGAAVSEIDPVTRSRIDAFKAQLMLFVERAADGMYGFDIDTHMDNLRALSGCVFNERKVAYAELSRELPDDRALLKRHWSTLVLIMATDAAYQMKDHGNLFRNKLAEGYELRAGALLDGSLLYALVRAHDTVRGVDAARGQALLKYRHDSVSSPRTARMKLAYVERLDQLLETAALDTLAYSAILSVFGSEDGLRLFFTKRWGTTGGGVYRRAQRQLRRRYFDPAFMAVFSEYEREIEGVHEVLVSAKYLKDQALRAKQDEFSGEVGSLLMQGRRQVPAADAVERALERVACPYRERVAAYRELAKAIPPGPEGSGAAGFLASFIIADSAAYADDILGQFDAAVTNRYHNQAVGAAVQDKTELEKLLDSHPIRRELGDAAGLAAEVIARRALSSRLVSHLTASSEDLAAERVLLTYFASESGMELFEGKAWTRVEKRPLEARVKHELHGTHSFFDGEVFKSFKELRLGLQSVKDAIDTAVDLARMLPEDRDDPFVAQQAAQAEKFLATVKRIGYKAREDGRTILIGIESGGWVPDGQRGMFSPLIREFDLDRLSADLARLGLGNVKIVHGAGDAFERSVIDAVRDNGISPENVVVMGRRECVHNLNALPELRGTQKGDAAFFAELDTSGMKEWQYIRLVEMVTIAVKLAFGEAVVQANHPRIMIDRMSERVVRLIPDAEQLDPDLLKQIYERQAGILRNA